MFTLAHYITMSYLLCILSYYITKLYCGVIGNCLNILTCNLEYAGVIPVF